MKTILIIIALFYGSHLYADTYLIAFSVLSDSNLGTSFYLMRIDDQGHVIQGPQRVWRKKSFSIFSVTLNDRDKNTLNLWSSPAAWNSHVHRAIIDKRSWKLLKVYR